MLPFIISMIATLTVYCAYHVLSTPRQATFKQIEQWARDLDRKRPIMLGDLHKSVIADDAFPLHYRSPYLAPVTEAV